MCSHYQPTTVLSLSIGMENLSPLSGCTGQRQNVRKAARP